ncbi:cytochrome P450 [Aspergillus luchuensis]|uniref:Cytochrome P450 n=1 Tax=Aspergillus kawachii TaxID=1069201 RepID=A0A146F7N3_ASPKA|nr:cytochrome P450 [Aspergillus luchuensis]
MGSLSSLLCANSISRDFNPEPVGVGKAPFHRGSGLIHGQRRVRDNLQYLSKGAYQVPRESELAAYVQLLSCFPNILFDGDSPIPHTRAMGPND